MSQYVHPVAQIGAAFTEFLGIVIIVVITTVVLLLAIARLVRQGPSQDLYHDTRQRLARGILLGLEFLVAADIIHTVAVDLSFKSVGVLAMILLIRSFLSVTLELELTGRWPWQQERKV